MRIQSCTKITTKAERFYNENKYLRSSRIIIKSTILKAKPSLPKKKSQTKHRHRYNRLSHIHNNSVKAPRCIKLLWLGEWATAFNSQSHKRCCLQIDFPFENAPSPRMPILDWDSNEGVDWICCRRCYPAKMLRSQSGI